MAKRIGKFFIGVLRFFIYGSRSRAEPAKYPPGWHPRPKWRNYRR